MIVVYITLKWKLGPGSFCTILGSITLLCFTIARETTCNRERLTYVTTAESVLLQNLLPGLMHSWCISVMKLTSLGPKLTQADSCTHMISSLVLFLYF